ncbi:putative short chain oxidoreductase [Bisporella sp. PMI_857]|nr:putative short chain oxidoreductase [Bisporella sp. PMI_857]
MASYLITGCSRGLGLAMATHLATLPSEIGTIFATARKETAALTELAQKSSGRVVFIQLDAADETSIRNAIIAVEKALGGKGLDVLINNAGKMGFSPEGITSMNDLDSHFTTNVISVHLVTRTFLPLLQKGSLKKVANISTTLGSITLAAHFDFSPSPAYKVSKAALNMLTIQYALAYKKEEFTIFSISPGWVRTELGGPAADLSVEEGAIATLGKILAAGKEDNGAFMNIRVKGWENL